jgi:hypothetical protein
MDNLTKQQLNELSKFFLTKHIECLQLQNKMSLNDTDINCKLLFNEHFKYFRKL